MADEPYSKVTRRMWTDERFRSLSAPKPNAQTLWQYLLTGPRCTPLPGLLAVGVLGLADDLSWPPTTTQKCLAEIEVAGMAVVDHVAKLIWLPNALAKHNLPANASVVLGWSTPWRALPECSLRARAAEAMRATLAKEDARRVEAGARTGGLAVAFAVVLGEVPLAEAGLRVGRPRKPSEAVEEQGAEHCVPHPVPHPVEQGADLHGARSRTGTTATRSAGAREPIGDQPQPPRIANIQIPASLVEYGEIAQRLADEGNDFGQSMVERMARCEPITARQRGRLREIDAENRAADAVVGRSSRREPSELDVYAARRWVEARRRKGLGANQPDPRLVADLASIALCAAVDAVVDGEGWRPSGAEIVAAWIRRFLAEKQAKAGGVEDEGYPLNWLVSRCRNYPLPKRAEVQRQAPAAPPSASASTPHDAAAIAPPPAAARAPEPTPPPPEVAEAGLRDLMAGIGGGAGPDLAPRAPAQRPVLRVITGGGG